MLVQSPSFDLTKFARHAWRRSAKLKRMKYFWRRRLIEVAPLWAHRLLGSIGCYFDMLFLDHGVFRILYVNQHRLGQRAWRSGQPAPHQIGALARRGLRTIVNLRGERLCGSYLLEKSIAERHGITLVNFKIRSRFAPGRADIRAAAELFERVEYPILLHCKSGADRAGLMSVLYRHLKEGVPIIEAKQQLSLRYGHFRRRKAGVLDHFFESYIDDNKRSPMPFLHWVDKFYDPEALDRSFASRRRQLSSRARGRE